MLLIIDEAQLSYQHDTLWTDFIKPISSDGDEGRRVILFSSYGSPAETPLLDGGLGSPPLHLYTNNESLSDNNKEVSLYFTRLEFDDVVTRVCKHSSEGQPFRPYRSY